MSENTIVESTLTQRESNVTIREGLEVGSTDSFTLRNFREYEIIKQLPAQGGEADIYVISKNGKRFILKLYRFGIDPNLDALKKIKKITNENTKNFINILMNLSLTPTIYCGRIKLQKMLRLTVAVFYDKDKALTWLLT